MVLFMLPQPSIYLFYLFLLLGICTLIVKIDGAYVWSFQQRIVLPTAGSTYAQTPSFLVGRGFQTLITGYSGNDSSIGVPGVFVHTNDDGYVFNHQNRWTLQARLIPIVSTNQLPVTIEDGFGTSMVANNQTLIISAPYQGFQRGFAYVFNGTGRHWTYIQRLQIAEGAPNDQFGVKMHMSGNVMIAGATGTTSTDSMPNAGAAHVFARVGTTLFWTRQGRLLPRDWYGDQYFGSSVAIYGNTAVVSARNDDYQGDQTGSVYVFASSGGLWSQQQKLIAIDMQNFVQKVNLEKLDISFGTRFLGPDVDISNGLDITVGVTNKEPGKNIRDSVFIFSTTSGTGRWSLQQRLFRKNDTHSQLSYHTSVYVNQPLNTMVATAYGPNDTVAYVFKSFGNGWSLQAKLISWNSTEEPPYYNNDPSQRKPNPKNFTNPTLWGGTLLFSAENEVQIRTQYRNHSCMVIWMSDHYRDGWDTAVLTVRAPDGSNDTFHPHCDQVDPFEVRYCPYQPSDEGVYIVKVFAATQARFFWEISWQVTLESTGEVFRGDFSTKLMFRWDPVHSQFSIVSSENLIDFNSPCYSCTTISRSSWTQLQIRGNSAFWPLVVTGAPYYISDYQGRELAASGKVCVGAETTQCYQTLTDGIYILRLGGGLFGKQLGFPMKNATWNGCQRSGGVLDQFIFVIAGGQCNPVQIHHWATRCDRPAPINAAGYSSTLSPTFGGTVAPSKAVYGEPYVPGQMYSVREKDSNDHMLPRQRIDPNLLQEEVVEKQPGLEIVPGDADDDSNVPRESRPPTAAPTEAFLF